VSDIKAFFVGVAIFIIWILAITEIPAAGQYGPVDTTVQTFKGCEND